MRFLAIIFGFVAALLATAASAQTPNVNLLRMNGGIHPAYYCDYTQGAFCGGESYSTTSLRTVVDATGVVTYAGNELLTYNNAFNNAAWSTNSGTVTANAAISPTGANDAAMLTSSGGSVSGVDQLASASVGTQVIAFVYAKAGTSNYVAITLFGAASSVYFNLSNGSISGNIQSYIAGIASVGNGWYQCWLVLPYPSSAYTYFLQSNNGINLTTSAGKTIYVWHAGVSAVTYETSPSQLPAGDQTVTTSAAYYGPALPDHNPATLASLGYRSEAAATNLYLNSGAPATQTITVVNATQYTGSIRDTGTQAFTGAFTAILTGAANTTTQTTQTSAATSLVATDTGLSAESYPQVETGAFASSPIVTGASSVTRAADSLTLTGLLAALRVTNPIIVERQSEATGVVSRTLYAKNTFATQTGYWYRKLAAYPANTPIAVLNAIVAMQRPMK